jgi:hypothetical protein
MRHNAGVVPKKKLKLISRGFHFSLAIPRLMRDKLDFEHLVDISTLMTDGEAFTEKSRYDGSMSNR